MSDISRGNSTAKTTTPRGATPVTAAPQQSSSGIHIDWSDTKGTKNDPMPWLSKDAPPSSIQQNTGNSDNLLSRILNPDSRSNSVGSQRSSSRRAKARRTRGATTFCRGFATELTKPKTVEERLGLRYKKVSQDAILQNNKSLVFEPQGNMDLGDGCDGEGAELLETVQFGSGEFVATPKDPRQEAKRNFYQGGHDPADDEEMRQSVTSDDDDDFKERKRRGRLHVEGMKRNRIALRKVTTPRDRVELQKLQEECPYVDKEAHGAEYSPRTSLQATLLGGGLHSARHHDTPGGIRSMSAHRIATWDEQQRSQSQASYARMSRHILNVKEVAHGTLNQREFELEMEVENLKLDLRHAYGGMYGAEEHLRQLNEIAEAGMQEQGDLVVDLIAETIATAAEETHQQVKKAMAALALSQKNLAPPPPPQVETPEKKPNESEEEDDNGELSTPLSRKERAREAARRIRANGATWGDILWGPEETDYLAVVTGILVLFFTLGIVLYLTLPSLLGTITPLLQFLPSAWR